MSSILKDLLSLNKVARPWHLPLVTGFVIGLPAIFGALTNTFGEALLSSLGAMVFLYMSGDRTASRMLTMSLCAFGFMACLTLATLSTVLPWLPPFALTAIAFLVILITRYYRLPPPGSFFFILASCVALAMPFDLGAVSNRVGLIALGGMWAVLAAFVYSVVTQAHKAEPQEITVDPQVNALIIEAALTSSVLGASYGFALWIGMNNPYWVPISCAAIMQGATFRMVWHRNVHRVVGTTLGMLLAALLFSFDPSPLVLALCICAFQAIVDYLIVKNYGFAVIFITPLTVIMAEMTSLGMSASLLLEYRFIDIVLGSFFGFIGGALFHRTDVCRRIEAKMSPRSRLSDLL